MKQSAKRICSALLALCLLLVGCGMLAACRSRSSYSPETAALVDAILEEHENYPLSVSPVAGQPSPNTYPALQQDENYAKLKACPDAAAALLAKFYALRDQSASALREGHLLDAMEPCCGINLLEFLLSDEVFRGQVKDRQYQQFQTDQEALYSELHAAMLADQASRDSEAGK